MILPKKIKVNKRIYTVKQVKQVDAYHSAGDWTNIPRRIRIKKGMNDVHTLQTFVHEVMHAAEHEYGFELKHIEIYKLDVALGRALGKVFKLNLAALKSAYSSRHRQAKRRQPRR